MRSRATTSLYPAPSLHRPRSRSPWTGHRGALSRRRPFRRFHPCGVRQLRPDGVGLRDVEPGKRALDRGDPAGEIQIMRVPRAANANEVRGIAREALQQAGIRGRRFRRLERWRERGELVGEVTDAGHARVRRRRARARASPDRRRDSPARRLHWRRARRG